MATDINITNSPLNVHPTSVAGDFADGASVTLGTTADVAYSGTGSGTLVALAKYIGSKIEAVRALLAGTLATNATITNASLAVTQATGTNLHTVVDSGAVTATISGTPNVAVTTLPALATGTNAIGSVSVTGTTSVSVSNTPTVSVTNPSLVVNSTTGAVVALSTPPAALTASTDTAFTFASQVKHVLIQNNSATATGVAFDTAATAGSFQLAPNQTLLLDVEVTAVHFWSTAATNVNGAAAANITLLGWA